MSCSPRFAALFRHRPLAFYFWAHTLSELSHQIAAIAVGWQIYALTNGALALGLIGLMQFGRTAALIFIAAHAAGRFDRTRIMHAPESSRSDHGLSWLGAASRLVPDIFAAVAVPGAHRL
jgi:hypothetical protein